MDQKEEIIQLQERIKALELENSNLINKQFEINQAKELYLKIFEDFPALIWRSRLDMLCDYFNKTWLDFTGRTMEQEFGNGWAEGVHPDDFDFCLKTYVNAFDKRDPFLMEYRMKNKLGEYCWIRDFGRPFYDIDNSFLGYIGSCYDITELKNNEIKLVELNSTKDKFFSIIAHDIKSPFTGILGFSEILKNEVLELDRETIADYARIINSSATQTYRLVENLLEWASIQQGKIQFKPILCQLKPIVQELIDLEMEKSKQKGIDLICNIPEDLQVYADPNILKTILRNLISNGLKFTNRNGKVEVETEMGETEVRISVKDNGMGISRQNIEFLFDMGAGNTTPGTENEKGTGLGLHLCKEFVEMNGGKIWVESEEGKGSVFAFSLPKNSPC